MTVRGSVAVIAALASLCLAPGARAQMPGAAPQQQMPAGMAPPQQQALPCMNDFMPLRAEAEKRAMALKATMEKKPTREEACSAFKSFTAAESKMVEYIKANAQWCGIPAEVPAQMQAQHSRTLKTQGQVCTGMPAKPKRMRMARNAGCSSVPIRTAFYTM